MFSCSKESEKEYVENAIDIMEKNSIRKDSIDWEVFRTNAIGQIKDQKGLSEMHHIISSAVYELGDNHSFLLTKEMEAKLFNEKNPLPFVESRLIDEKIGYLKIPSFIGNDRRAEELATIIQNEIRDLDKNETDLWMIDLRGNSGGNMFPMYLGLAPILKEGISGYFSMADKSLKAWSYKDNAVFVESDKKLEIKNSYTLKNANPKIAVLIDGDTGSSGEAIAIAFKGFSKTKFFGFRTYGVSTGNDIFELSDGAKLVLTTSVFVDRNKKIYGKQVEPDIYSYQPKKDAVEWLLNK